MSGWAKPGVKCVCVIDIPPLDARGLLRMPAKGEVLTVRDVQVSRGGTGYLRFEEIRNPEMVTDEGFLERGYARSRFRPLVAQSDDVALFAHHLVGQTEPA